MSFSYPFQRHADAGLCPVPAGLTIIIYQCRHSFHTFTQNKNMKIIKWAGIVLLTIVLISAIAAGGFLQSQKPDYSEDFSLTGLQDEVEVYFDDYAIPHIYAKTDVDAYRTLGYLQAKERLWQMELVRRIAPGRLSEVFGEATLETDKLFRTLGIHQYSVESMRHFDNGMDPEIKELVLAYLDGVNQFIDKGDTPLEFLILGLEKSHFSPIDVYNVLGYMSFSFAMAHKTEPVLTYVLENFGPGLLNDLQVHVDSATTMIASGIGTAGLKEFSINVGKIMNQLPVPAFIGSNSWVVSGAKTKSGQPFFANDPHIGFSQPAVWYEAHLNTPNFETYGYFLGGFPFPQLSHNAHHAIGLTMFENDDIDMYREKQHPDNADEYEYKEEWLEYDSRVEIINVKDAESVNFIVKTTVHGPIVNESLKSLSDKYPVSLWWNFVKHPNHSLEAAYQMTMAKNMDEARKGASLIHGPGLNVMYADRDGNIAWWACAKLPKRPEHVNSKLILDGSSGADEPIGYYDFSENPHAENPDWDYVYSANNQPVVKGQPLHPGYYLPEDRARRIVHLLEGKDNWTADEIKAMQLDVTSDNVPEITASLLMALESSSFSAIEKNAFEVLETWNGGFEIENTAPVIYNKWLYHITYSTFADELGDDLFDVFNGTHIMKRSLQPLFANSASKWWDDVNTTDFSETMTDIVTKAFKQSVEELEQQLGPNTDEWQWGRVHTLEHNHSFSAVPSLKKYFNVGTFPAGGNIETINNLMHRLQPDGTYEVLAGPSTRRVVDFADVAGNSWSILPTGQSGNVMSDHYSDQAEMYAQGEFRRQLLDKEEIVEKAKYKAVILNDE